MITLRRHHHQSGPLGDQEVVADFAHDPTLLLIADLVFVAQLEAPDIVRRRVGRIRSSSRPLRAAGALGVACLVAVFTVALWPASSPSLLERARANVGSERVLKVVTTTPSDLTSVDVDTGESRPLLRTTEIAYDTQGQVVRTSTQIDGQLVEESLATPTGGSTSFGPVFTCARIKDRPAEARRLGLACASPGSEKFVGVREELRGFVDGYQNALRSGSAELGGDDVVRGRAITWIRFHAHGQLVNVAVTQDTAKPIEIRMGAPRNGAVVVIDSITTEPFDPDDFRPPARLERVPGGVVVDQTEIDSVTARTVIPRPLLISANPKYALTSLRRATSRDTDGRRAEALVLTYASGAGLVDVIESRTPPAAFGWGILRGLNVPEGKFIQTIAGSYAQIDGIYVVIRAPGSLQLPAERVDDVVSSLKPAASP